MEPLLYTDINVTDQMLTADQIILRWKEDRRDISRNVNVCDIQKLWQYIIPQNEQCSCKITGISSTKSTCIGCKIVSRLYKNGDIVPNTGITIKPGNIHNGLQYYTFITDSTTPGPLRNYKRVEYSVDLLSKITSSQKCGDQQQTFFFASQGTYVEHYAVISSIIEYEMNKILIPCIPIFRWLWKCESNIGIVENITNLGRGTFEQIVHNTEFMDTPRSPVASRSATLPFRLEIGRGLLMQLAVSLHFLGSYSFMHGSPSLRNIAFSRTPVDFLYKGVNIVSPITLHIIPSGTSSISVGIPDTHSCSLRIFHPGAKCNRHTDTIEILSGSHYKIGNNKHTFNNYIKYLGLPLFTNSIDLYMFLTVFMYEDSFCQYVNNDSPIFDLIKSLFIDGEYKKYLFAIDNLRKRLFERNSVPCSEDILDTIAPFTLRCDAINYLWATLSVIK